MSAISEARGRMPRRSPRRRNVDTARIEELLVKAGNIVLAEGFTTITMDQLAQRLSCSKATLYSVAGTKEQLVQTITRRFFATATEEIERAVAEEGDPRRRIRTYLAGVGTAMRLHSPAFYDDMVNYEPTARIYRKSPAGAVTPPAAGPRGRRCPAR
jgi:AcrR family transcriptional regulator